METVNDIWIFCKAAVFYNYENIGIIFEVNKVRKIIITIFEYFIPTTRILIALCIIDVIFLKINDTDIENVVGNIIDLRDNILYRLWFKKTD